MSDPSGDLRTHMHDQLASSAGRIDCHVTDTLSRQRKRFAVRIAHNRIVIKFRYAGGIYAGKYNFAIRFIGNDIKYHVHMLPVLWKAPLPAS